MGLQATAGALAGSAKLPWGCQLACRTPLHPSSAAQHALQPHSGKGKHRPYQLDAKQAGDTPPVMAVCVDVKQLDTDIIQLQLILELEMQRSSGWYTARGSRTQ